MNGQTQIPVWDLNVLYRNFENLLNDAKKILKLSEQFNKKYKSKFEENNFSITQIKEMLLQITKISELMAKANGYIFLRYSQDISNENAKKYLNILDEISTRVSNNMLFFTLKFNSLNKNIQSDILENKEIKEFKHYLERIIAEKKFQLDEKEEKIINTKDMTGINAFQRLYTNITSKYQYEIEINNEKKILSESQIIQLRYNTDSNIRRKSSIIQFNKYRNDGEILAEIYNNIAKDLYLENRIRGFKNNLQAENFSNELSDKVINNLIDVTNSNINILKEFYLLKAKLMGVDKLRLCDTRVAVKKQERKFSWNESKEIILESFSEFDNKFYRIAKLFFEENKIDAQNRENKMEGAYCYYISPSIYPYISMKFLGNINDIISLAHELGHGIHGVFSSKQNMLNYWPVQPFAEIASIFAELLVTDKLLKLSKSKDEKIFLLTRKMDDIIGTTFRQNLFTNFEISAHKLIENEYLSLEKLNEIYFDKLKDLYCGSVELLDEFHYEWLSIRHLFVAPFYCYSYNFAQLFVLALFEYYLEDGKNFKKKYFQLLESGGNNSPEKLAKIISVDINDPCVWNKGFEVVKIKFLNELKNILL